VEGSVRFVANQVAAVQPGDPPPAASLGGKGFVRGSRYYDGGQA
jgi:hypothetical protein